MPKVFFMIPNDDEGRVIGEAVDVESVPRVGEYVSMFGPAFGDGGIEGCSNFVVERVQYQFHVDQDEKIEESECPNVWLREDMQAFRMKCTCDPKDRAPAAHDPKRCDECGDRIP